MSAAFTFAQDNKVGYKYLINIGALLDIPTGSIITGAKGESIINGGLGQIIGIVGAGNNFKSTLLHYMMLSAASRIAEAYPTYMLTYDTEINIDIERLNAFASRFPSLGPDPIFRPEPAWIVTDKRYQPANKWAEDLGEYMDNKTKDTKNYITYDCFIDPYTKKPVKVPLPTFAEIDSFTEFESESAAEMLSGDVDSKDTNTYAMKQGNFKTKLASTLPARCTASGTYILLTAHTGGKVDMNAKPWEEESKKLQFLKSGDSIKGVGTKFSFLTNMAYQALGGSALYNNNTKSPEYPKDGYDVNKNELNRVTLTILRNKTGQSGVNLEILISQSEGVLPSLTEFHFLKSNKSGSNPGWGMSGNDRNYSLDLLPDVNLSRTTIRNKLDTDPILARAMNITSEMLQLQIFNRQVMSTGLMCTPKELYEDIKKLGYDWNILLKTRGYWTPNQYTNPVPFLSTVDLLKMRKGLYHPYWYPKKDLKPGE